MDARAGQTGAELAFGWPLDANRTIVRFRCKPAFAVGHDTELMAEIGSWGRPSSGFIAEA
jgi:hypothetical protein